MHLSYYTLDEEPAYVKCDIPRSYTYKEGWSYVWSQDENVLFVARAYRVRTSRVELADVWLREDKRGRGYATRLLSKVLIHLQENDIQKVVLVVHKWNEDAIALYEKLGFQRDYQMVHLKGRKFSARGMYTMEKMLV